MFMANYITSMVSEKALSDLTGFQRDVLSAVFILEQTTDNITGLDVKKELEEMYEGDIHHGRLYPALDLLVKKSLLEKSILDRKTNKYSTTSRGEFALKQQLDLYRQAL